MSFASFILPTIFLFCPFWSTSENLLKISRLKLFAFIEEFFFSLVRKIVFFFNYDFSGAATKKKMKKAPNDHFFCAMSRNVIYIFMRGAILKITIYPINAITTYQHTILALAQHAYRAVGKQMKGKHIKKSLVYEIKINQDMHTTQHEMISESSSCTFHTSRSVKFSQISFRLNGSGWKACDLNGDECLWVDSRKVLKIEQKN